MKAGSVGLILVLICNPWGTWSVAAETQGVPIDPPAFVLKVNPSAKGVRYDDATFYYAGEVTPDEIWQAAQSAHARTAEKFGEELPLPRGFLVMTVSADNTLPDGRGCFRADRFASARDMRMIRVLHPEVPPDKQPCITGHTDVKKFPITVYVTSAKELSHELLHVVWFLNDPSGNCDTVQIQGPFYALAGHGTDCDPFLESH